jgi:hypothetical protein
MQGPGAGFAGSGNLEDSDMNSISGKVGFALCQLALFALSPALAQDEADSTYLSAITSGDAGIVFRPRYEFVDQDNISEDANALTALVRLNYRTGEWRNWSAFGEFDHVFHLIDDFNSGAGTSPNRGQYPVVADPEGSDLNQLYFDYGGFDDWNIRAGRQRINLDNQRFVGGVGWRQNEQTYDALTLTTETIANTTLKYSYISNVRRIFGQTSASGSDKTNHHLFNANIDFGNSWSLVPYIYLLDYNFGDITVPAPNPNDLRRAASSTSTFGARLAGQFKLNEDNTVSVLAEFATQSDYADNPVSYDADYLRADATWAMKNGISLGITYESLGSDGGTQSFRTPLATLHAFQGWADRFLATPAAGIDDVFVTGKFKLGNWNLTGIYHDFSAETGGEDFGTEFDFSGTTTFGKNYSLLLKAAFFSGDSPTYPDTTKFWVMLTAKY